MDDDITYNARIYRTEIYRGAKVTTYYVRWKAGGKPWRQPFRNDAQADSFRSALMTAARKGEAFSIGTGRPLSWKRDDADEQPSMTWYVLAASYAAAKWPYASPNHRRGIGEALTDATEVMLTTEDTLHTRDEIRRALRTWAFSARLRGISQPPDDIAPVVRWLETATIPVAELEKPGTGPVHARALLDRISKKQDGKLAAANTANRKRTTLNNAMQYAIELNLLKANPLAAIKWTRPRTLKTIDPRCAVNADQARRFIAAVGELGPRAIPST